MLVMGRSVSAREGFAMATESCLECRGDAGLELSVREFLSSLAAEICVPLPVMCALCPPPLWATGPCSSAGELLARREKGPFPSSVERLSGPTVLRNDLRHVLDVACRKRTGRQLQRESFRRVLR